MAGRDSRNRSSSDWRSSTDSRNRSRSSSRSRGRDYGNDRGGSYGRNSSSDRSGYSRGSNSSRSGGRSPAGVAVKMNWLFLLITLAAGIVAWLIGTLVYSGMVDTASRPWLIGLIFLILYVIVVLTVFIFSNITAVFRENMLTGSPDKGLTALILLAGAVIVFFLAAFFQWLYGLSASAKQAGPTSYVFVIDDSGSMTANDPDGERYTAIREVLRDMDSDFPYMVYGFSNDTTVLQPMTTVGKGLPQLSGASDGGTAIRGALKQVLEDYQSGVWKGGDSPRVILLTDGVAGDIGLFRPINPVLKQYAKARISVSTVGLGDADENLMRSIAESTGGVYIDVSDATELSAAMKSAAVKTSAHDLLSVRYSSHLGWLYGFLRILFLTILGCVIGLGALVAYGYADTANLLLVATGATSLLGALLMELSTGLGASAGLMWLILWILYSATAAGKPVYDPGRMADIR